MSERQSKATGEELDQAHSDLDTFDIPREEGGLTLSVPGRILLMARMHCIERNKLIDDLSYADLRASGGIFADKNGM